MSNDLELYQNNDLAPLQPGGVDLYTPSAEDHWGSEPDYLSERGVQPLADPTVEQNFQNIAHTFTNDMASLGFVQRDIDKCINWFRQSLANPVQRMPQIRHKYQTWQFSNDPAFQAFCNYAATQRFPQSLIQSVAYWIQQLDDYTHGQGRFKQVQAPVSSNPEDQLNDAQWEAVVVANERAQARTMGILKDRWGSSFEANLRMVQNYFQSLPARDQEHLSQYSTGWIKATNTVEMITSLYAQAIGANSLPSGGALASEIAQHEHVMKYDRKRWNSDDQLQARYRELIRRRDGSR